jgi:thiol-disulfide isomerase/thioredoxin
MTEMKATKLMAGIIAMLAGTTLSFAATATLKVGDPAPKLQLGKWVQGSPVKDFEKGKAYIVEFWATWCPPCRESIPHLNETFNKYKDKGLTIIAVDSTEDENAVGPFIKRMGAVMTYPVALDDKDGNGQAKMAQTWMGAAGREGIPSAFLVDTSGNIMWIGSPLTLRAKIIEDVLAGNYSLKQALADAEKEQKNEAQLASASAECDRAIKSKDWDTALAKLTEVEGLLPEEQRPRLDMIRFQILIQKKDYPAAYKQAREISDANLDNTLLQNELAWRLAAQPGLEKRDLELAELIAIRAQKASTKEDNTRAKLGALDTLARVKFMRGKKEEAVALETQAVEIAEESLKPAVQKTLESYKKGELPATD